MTMINQYLDFCAQSFWGDWKIALLKISMLFTIALVVTFACNEAGLFFADHNILSIVATALIATITTIGLGLGRKKQKL